MRIGDMKQPGKFFPGCPAESGESRESETTGRYTTLTLMDEHPHKERGYNPYDTVAHAAGTRRDVWRQKPKRT
jgi:hypothetical protein